MKLDFCTAAVTFGLRAGRSVIVWLYCYPECSYSMSCHVMPRYVLPRYAVVTPRSCHGHGASCMISAHYVIAVELGSYHAMSYCSTATACRSCRKEWFPSAHFRFWSVLLKSAGSKPPSSRVMSDLPVSSALVMVHQCIHAAVCHFLRLVHLHAMAICWRRT